jgi:hypothetical protein
MSESLASAIRRAILAHCQALGIDRGRELAERVLAAVCASHGGERCYLPRPSKRERDRAIAAAEGTPEDIAREYGLHPVTVRTIRKRQRAGLGPQDWEL